MSPPPLPLPTSTSNILPAQGPASARLYPPLRRARAGLHAWRRRKEESKRSLQGWARGLSTGGVSLRSEFTSSKHRVLDVSRAAAPGRVLLGTSWDFKKKGQGVGHRGAQTAPSTTHQSPPACPWPCTRADSVRFVAGWGEDMSSVTRREQMYHTLVGPEGPEEVWTLTVWRQEAGLPRAWA